MSKTKHSSGNMVTMLRACWCREGLAFTAPENARSGQNGSLLTSVSKSYGCFPPAVDAWPPDFTPLRMTISFAWWLVLRKLEEPVRQLDLREPDIEGKSFRERFAKFIV
jgi:hypothetical protein